MKKNTAKKEGKTNIFRLVKKVKQTQDVQTFKFKPEDKKKFLFRPGEYVTLYFLDNRFGWQGKPYSLSGLPEDDALAITVKKIGNFSSAIHNLQIGGKVRIEGPTGTFCPAPFMENLIFLAAGIGITPVFSILRDFARNNKLMEKEIFVFYSNKTKSDIVFFKELNKIASKHGNLKIIYTLTREKQKDSLIQEFGRIGTDMLKKYIEASNKNYYFMSGSISFVNDQWKRLSDLGVPEKNLFTEAYY